MICISSLHYSYFTRFKNLDLHSFLLIRQASNSQITPKRQRAAQNRRIDEELKMTRDRAAPKRRTDGEPKMTRDRATQKRKIDEELKDDEIKRFAHPNLSKSYAVTYLSTTLGTLVAYPIEVLKLVVVRKKFNVGPWRSASMIFRIWGIRGFYCGVPIVLIQSAGGAIGLLVIAVLYRAIVDSD